MTCKHDWKITKNSDQAEKNAGFNLLAKCPKCDFHHMLNSDLKKFLQEKDNVKD